MPFETATALEYVKLIDLSGTRRNLRDQDAVDTGVVFDAAKKQAQVVGAGVYSFAEGVTAEVRESISDSALLAQLVANKRTSAETEPFQWFKVYSEVLMNVGWTLQESSWTDYTATGTALEVHGKIIEVLTVALGPSVAVLALVTATMQALTAMDDNSPWITLFSRESETASIGHFQIGLVEKGENDQVFVSLLACLIEAKNDVTQILFFKFKQANATFKADSNKISINSANLRELGPSIRNKIRFYQEDYLSTIFDV